MAVLPLNSRSHAFAVRDPENPFIIVDESVLSAWWMTEEHLMIILAHETGHILGDTDDELTVDKIGIELVREAGMDDVLELYLTEHGERLERGHYK